MSKHAIYVVPICLGLFYLGYRTLESHEEKVGQNRFVEECLVELNDNMNDSIKIVALENSDRESLNNSEGNFDTQNSFCKAIDSSGFFIVSDKGDSLLFKSILSKENQDSAWVTYAYLGYHGAGKVHWVAKTTYKKTANLLISQSVGTIYEVGYPHINKNGAFIFSNQDPNFWMYEGAVPGFKVWRNEGGVLILAYDVKLRSCCVVDEVWKSNNQLVISVRPVTEFMVSDTKSEQFELTFPTK